MSYAVDSLTPSFHLTPAAHAVMAQAEQESRGLGHSYIGATHLLMALSKTQSGNVKHALTDAGATYDGIKAGVVRKHGGGWAGAYDNLAYTARVRTILEKARYSASGQDITPNHLLGGLIDHGVSDGAAVLKGFAPLSSIRRTLDGTKSETITLESVNAKLDSILEMLADM